MSASRPAHVLLGACVLLLVVAATCSGQLIRGNISFNLSGFGARAAGMGGAFVGVADDATAAMWNPAGLTQLERPEFSIVSKVVVDRVEFDGFEGLLGKNESLSGHFTFDFGSFVYPVRVGDRKLVLDLSFQHRIDLFDSRRFFRQGEVVDVEQRGAIDVIAPGMALRLVGPLAVGGALNIWSGDVDLISRGIEPAETSVFIADADFRGVNTTLGLLLDLSSSGPSWPVKIGGVFRQPFDLEVDSRLQSTVDSVTVVGEFVNGELNSPSVAAIGGSIRLGRDLTLAADYERRHFSHSNVVLDPPLFSGDSADENEFRVGAEYTLVGEHQVFPLRVGFRSIPSLLIFGDTGDPLNQEPAWMWAFGAGVSTHRFSIDGAVEVRTQNDEQPGGTQKLRRVTLAFSGIFYM